MESFRGLLYEKQNGECCLCKYQVDIQGSVVHHDHSTGKIVGLAHQKCNIREGAGALIKIRRM